MPCTVPQAIPLQLHCHLKIVTRICNPSPMSYSSVPLQHRHTLSLEHSFHLVTATIATSFIALLAQRVTVMKAAPVPHSLAF